MQEGNSARSPLSMMSINQQQIERLVKSCLLRKVVQIYKRASKHKQQNGRDMPCSVRLGCQNSFTKLFESSGYRVLFLQFATSNDIKKYLRISQAVLLRSETQHVIPQYSNN